MRQNGLAFQFFWLIYPVKDSVSKPVCLNFVNLKMFMQRFDTKNHHIVNKG